MKWPDNASEFAAGRGTIEVPDFDEVLPIFQAVSKHGDEALARLNQEHDGWTGPLEATGLAEAWLSLDPQTRQDLEFAHARIAKFHSDQMPSVPMASVGRRVIPVDAVGIYVPGGKAAYPSSALMCVAAAKAAGVEQIIVCSPASEGQIPPITLGALYLAGATRVFKVGGAQAIFAMALGTDSIPRVQRIVGPGNRWVANAKAFVAGWCPIDSPAGPSEILVLADESADPGFVAGECLAQAEHDEDARIAVAGPEQLLAEVQSLLRTMKTERQEIADAALTNAQFIVAKAEDLADVCNAWAPEHVSIQTSSPEHTLQQLRNYGAAFLGQSPVALGDYVTGTNHVLPTGGMAAAWGPLSVDTFLRKPTHQATTNLLSELGPVAARLARMEGLYAHAKTVEQ